MINARSAFSLDIESIDIVENKQIRTQGQPVSENLHVQNIFLKINILKALAGTN